MFSIFRLYSGRSCALLGAALSKKTKQQCVLATGIFHTLIFQLFARLSFRLFAHLFVTLSIH
jgi:hypothetical protein